MYNTVPQQSKYKILFYNILHRHESMDDTDLYMLMQCKYLFLVDLSDTSARLDLQLETNGHASGTEIASQS